jgi:DNA-binding NtrC family response regulator
MVGLRARVERAAASDCSVLLTGETGTGKGEVARVLHALSAGSAARLVHVNCAALSPTVIESELFGHERGAFTDASSRRAGSFERAEGGTLFLDEVAELSLNLQAKLLRVLHDRRYERVGGGVTLAMGARVVAATNRPLSAEVAAGRFRSDLYYRLAVVELKLPPLRHRAEDLPDLIAEITRRISVRLGARVSVPTRSGWEVLGRHLWPGNIRELANVLERVAVFWPEEAFDERLALMALGSEGSPQSLPPAHDVLDPATVRTRLANCSGNVSRLARELGLPRSTLRYRLARWADGGGWKESSVPPSSVRAQQLPLFESSSRPKNPILRVESD